MELNNLQSFLMELNAAASKISDIELKYKDRVPYYLIADVDSCYTKLCISIDKLQQRIIDMGGK